MSRILANMFSMYTHKHCIKRSIRKRKLPLLLIRLVGTEQCIWTLRDGVQTRTEGTELS